MSERDPHHLLDAYCRGAREIIAAKWTAVGIRSNDQATVDQLFVNGLDERMIVYSFLGVPIGYQLQVYGWL